MLKTYKSAIICIFYELKVNNIDKTIAAVRMSKCFSAKRLI